MNIHQRTEAFIRLGENIERIPAAAIRKAALANPWFTEENTRFALRAIAEMLNKQSIETYIDRYGPRLSEDRPKKTVGVVMAGNIPLVGFHDFFCVLMAGHHLKVKLSADDHEMMKAVSEMLISLEPGFNEMIGFADDRLTGFEAVIATGSNNTSRYFQSYFGKHPHVIRKNRSGLAVLDGTEPASTLDGLGEDIFRYFGMGCRNVSKVYVPNDYDWQMLFGPMQAYSSVSDHNKYYNNYIYNKTVMVLNQQEFYDTGFLLLKEDQGVSSPLSVLHFEYYQDIREVRDFIKGHEEEIQCVVSAVGGLPDAVRPGSTQHPRIWDYADNVDTMEFLLSL